MMCVCSFVLPSNWLVGPTLHKWNGSFLFSVAYSVREIHKILWPVIHFCQLLFFCVLCSCSQLQLTLFTPSVWFWCFFWLPPSPVSLRLFWGSFFCSTSFIFTSSSCFFKSASVCLFTCWSCFWLNQLLLMIKWFPVGRFIIHIHQSDPSMNQYLQYDHGAFPYAEEFLSNALKVTWSHLLNCWLVSISRKEELGLLASPQPHRLRSGRIKCPCWTQVVDQRQSPSIVAK